MPWSIETGSASPRCVPDQPNATVLGRGFPRSDRLNRATWKHCARCTGCVICPAEEGAVVRHRARLPKARTVVWACGSVGGTRGCAPSPTHQPWCCEAAHRFAHQKTHSLSHRLGDLRQLLGAGQIVGGLAPSWFRAQGWVSLCWIFGPGMLGIARPHILAHVRVGSGPEAGQVHCGLHRPLCG